MRYLRIVVFFVEERKMIRRGENAFEVRKNLGLPPDGRNARKNFERIETIFRNVLAPSVPTYDVNSVQGADFTEWCYTEGMNCFIAFTQSVEINMWLAHDVVQWEGDLEIVSSFDIADKWKPQKTYQAKCPYRIFFPPGDNARWIVNRDNVLRAFHEDLTWHIKPHPITSDEGVRDMETVFGVDRVVDRDVSGVDLLKNAMTIGFTVASEMGLIGMMLGKEIVNFSSFEYEELGRYYTIYRAIREAKRFSNMENKSYMNKFLCCPYSGFVPLTATDEEAEDRLTQYYEKSCDYRCERSPLTRPLPRIPAAPESDQ